MRPRRTDRLIVPVRDRRRRRRILTLRNAAFGALALLVAFALITIRSEMGGSPADGDYGRLYRRELPPAPQPAPVEIVREAVAVEDSVSADPLLIQAAARSQWIEPAPATASVPPVTFHTRDSRSRISIVGGPDGVVAVQATTAAERRVLKGGIFKE